MRKIKAYKRTLKEPIQWKLRINGKGVFYKIELDQEVMTPDGVMQRVTLRISYNSNRSPQDDYAILVASIVEPIIHNSWVHNRGHQSSEIWYWNDTFWAKALDSAYGSMYYRDKHYVLYPITIVDEHRLFESITIC